VFHHLADVGPMKVVVVSTVDLALGAVGAASWVFGAEVPDGALVGGVLFVLGTGMGVMGWALVLLVKLSGLMSAMHATVEEHERRLTNLERVP
jgi:hypothetical protein